MGFLYVLLGNVGIGIPLGWPERTMGVRQGHCHSGEKDIMEGWNENNEQHVDTLLV